MHPILFVIEAGGLVRPIATFGVLLALAMFFGSLLSIRATSRAGIDWSDGLASASIVCAGGLFGGYALQLVVETLRSGSFADALATGGLTYYGAPIAGTLALYGASRAFGFSFGRFLDAGIVGVPLAHALGRIGCFFAGCCYGEAWDGPCSVTFHHAMAPAAAHEIARHPVQLYEAGALLIVALALILVPPSRVGDGRRAATYAATYAVIRIVMERFRGDAERGFVALGLSTSDAISLALLLVAGGYLALRRPKESA